MSFSTISLRWSADIIKSCNCKWHSYTGSRPVTSTDGDSVCCDAGEAHACDLISKDTDDTDRMQLQDKPKNRSDSKFDTYDL